MIIILKNIPANTRKKDIEDFIRPIIKGGFFSRSGRIESIRIKGQRDTRFNTLEFHALVRVVPDAVAMKVVKKLNRKLFKGKHTAVNEFQYRNWRNDRRTDTRQPASDRRLADRRRAHLEVIEDVSERFSSKKSFHRKHE